MRDLTSPGRNAPYGSIAPAYGIQSGSNAALLIDFDNVTLSVRSDLGKEMKTLLNSDLIRGKVSVKRAYADWRRYPQYVVSLTESSIDLIMAPAIGTAKKNATDLRMAVDAMELVFVRPEIGTFILLTGDSDFSSCVMKLKEYGKYVIGVGMREAASDLLIQSCDEYYSYHALSGLTKATEDEGPREDPWQLVRRAAERMAANGDSMRTDRLKQVMLDIDPGFDEGTLGFSKFSRFVSEAASKGLLRLRKSDAGQYEIVVDGGAAPEEQTPAEREPASRERGRRNGRSRDRDRERERTPRPPRVEPAAATPEAEAAPAPEPDAQRLPEPATPEPAVAATGTAGPDTLDGSYALLQQVVRDAVGRNRGDTVRDGEAKRRMLEVAPDWDETHLGFSKFSRFLRQAHDAQVIDLRQLAEGGYEVALPASGKRLPSPQLNRVAPSAPVEPEPTEAPTAAPVVQAVAEPVPEPVASAPVREAAPAPAPRARVRGRRGGLGRGEGPPPLLPGQVVTLATPAAATPAETAPMEAAPVAEPETPAPQTPAPDAPEPQPELAAPAEEAAPARRSRGRGRGRGRKAASAPAPDVAAEEAPAEAAPEPATPPARPELPSDRPGIESYLTSRFKGVGKKTVDGLYNAFGDDVLRIMDTDPDRVRAAVSNRRVDTLLREFGDARNAEAATVESEAAAPEAPEPEVDEPATRPRSRSRRGGRGRSRRKAEPTPTD